MVVISLIFPHYQNWCQRVREDALFLPWHLAGVLLLIWHVFCFICHVDNVGLESMKCLIAEKECEVYWFPAHGCYRFRAIHLDRCTGAYIIILSEHVQRKGMDLCHLHASGKFILFAKELYQGNPFHKYKYFSGCCLRALSKFIYMDVHVRYVPLFLHVGMYPELSECSLYCIFNCAAYIHMYVCIV